MTGNQSRKIGLYFIIAFGVVFLAFLLIRMPPSPIIENDSTGYLHFSSIRPAGYPLFLALTGTQGAVVAQSVLAALTVTYLGMEMLFLGGSAIAALGLMAAIAINTPLDAFHYKILSDSLFVSLLTLLLGLLMRLARLRTLKTALAASLVAGLAITVRSAGWFLLPLMVLASLVLAPRGFGGARNRRALVLLLSLVGPLIVVTSLKRGYAELRFGSQPKSTLAILLYGKAGLIEAPPTGGAAPAVIALERDFAPIRALIARAPNFAVERALSLGYEACIEFECSKALGVRTSSPSAAAAAMARISANPLGLAKLFWRNYRALWTVYGASLDSGLHAFVTENRPLPFESKVKALTSKPRSVPMAQLIQPTLFAIGVVTALLTLLAWARLRQAGRSIRSCRAPLSADLPFTADWSWLPWRASAFLAICWRCGQR